jgi:hypothetical protein
MGTNDQFDSLEDALKRLKITEKRPAVLFRKYFEDNRKSKEQLKVFHQVVRLLRLENKRLSAQRMLLQQRQTSTDEDLHRINTRLVYVTNLNNDLAGALGGCFLCWGEDNGCKNCGGAGSPGWLAIDKHLFRKYVQPVLDKSNTTERDAM